MPSINAALSGHFSIGGDLGVVCLGFCIARRSCCLSRELVVRLIWKSSARAAALVLSEEECGILGGQGHDVWESSEK